MKWTNVIAISFLFLVIGFWKKNNLSENMQTLPVLSEEPLQIKTSEKEFTTNVNKVDYKIKPLYEYELVGMVVSYKLHDSKARLHKAWNDHLNVADLCVIWGDTATATTLPKVKFWNGQFTCNFSTRSNEAWNNFNLSQVSNNHLITDNASLRNKITKINIGDQIRVKGKLAEYTNLNHDTTRGTSITRDDTGNGACETIYVEEIEILNSYTSKWKKLMYLSLLLFIFSLTIYLRSPHQTKN